MTDTRMHVLHGAVDDRRPLVRSDDLIVVSRGPVNYHCGQCGTLLIRHASDHIPDAIVICPVCLELNEPEPASVWAHTAY